MKRFILAAVLAAFSFPAMAQSLPGSTILKPITGAFRLPYDATSRTLTNKFSDGTEIVRLVCTTACLVQMAVSGQTPVALVGGVSGSVYLPADRPEYMLAPRNGKIAAIRLSSDGILYVQEFGR